MGGWLGGGMAQKGPTAGQRALQGRPLHTGPSHTPSQSCAWAQLPLSRSLGQRAQLAGRGGAASPAGGQDTRSLYLLFGISPEGLLMHFKEASGSGKLFVLQIGVGGAFTICPAAVCPRLQGGACTGQQALDQETSVSCPLGHSWPYDLE